MSSKEIPKQFALFQNFPNPFNPETWIPYQLAEATFVEIRIYDAKGKLVRKIFLGKKEAGYYKTKETAAHWDGRDNLGQSVANGVYFYCELTGISPRTAHRDLIDLVKRGLLKSIGKGRGSRYVLAEKLIEK